MQAVRKLFTAGKALVAAIAICATAGSAKADLYLDVIDQFNQTSKSYALDIGSGANGSKTSSTSSDFNGFSVNYTVSSSQVGNRAVLSLDATVNATQLSSIRFVLRSNVGQSSSPVSNPTDGLYSPVAANGGAVFLFSTLTASGLASGDRITTYAGYTAYDGSTPGGIYTTPGAGMSPADQNYRAQYSASLNSNGSKTSNLFAFTQQAGTTSFDLSSISTDLQTAGTVSFRAQAIAVPETSGVVTALAGLPCLGMLVGFARRRALAGAAQTV